MVANWDYLHLPKLTGPRNDVDVMSIAYRSVGLEVINEARNLRSRQDILNHLHAFAARIAATVRRDGRIGFVGFHFAGHGTSGQPGAEPTNFLLSCDAADMTCPEIAGVELDEVVAALAVTPNLAIGLVIDACRKAAQAAREVAALSSPPLGFVSFDPERSLIRAAGCTPAWVGFLFSCQHGSAANDTVGNGGTPSPLAFALARTLRRALLPTHVGTLFHRVIARVEAATRTASVPGQRPFPKTAGAPDPKVGRKGMSWFAGGMACVLVAGAMALVASIAGGGQTTDKIIPHDSALPTQTAGLVSGVSVLTRNGHDYRYYDNATTMSSLTLTDQPSPSDYFARYLAYHYVPDGTRVVIFQAFDWSKPVTGQPVPMHAAVQWSSDMDVAADGPLKSMQNGSSFFSGILGYPKTLLFDVPSSSQENDLEHDCTPPKENWGYNPLKYSWRGCFIAVFGSLRTDQTCQADPGKLGQSCKPSRARMIKTDEIVLLDKHSGEKWRHLEKELLSAWELKSLMSLKSWLGK